MARVFTAELKDGSKIEFVESVQRPKTRADKWVLIISTLKGCPVGCLICDAGGGYHGKLSKDEIFAQIEYLITERYPDGCVPTKRLKIQFARMGDPALNNAVLGVLEELPRRIADTPVQPSISTIAPFGRDEWFDALIGIKDRLYADGRFQMQFSVHTTDDSVRRRLVPVRTWSMREMASFGRRFFAPGDLKVSLNFALAAGSPFLPDVLARIFSPETFIIKLTPINPTRSASKFKMAGIVDPGCPEACAPIIERLGALGFETILSIGDTVENEIGSNCGMYAAALSDTSSNIDPLLSL